MGWDSGGGGGGGGGDISFSLKNVSTLCLGYMYLGSFWRGPNPPIAKQI